jgi:hypothetical protein
MLYQLAYYSINTMDKTLLRSGLWL